MSRPQNIITPRTTNNCNRRIMTLSITSRKILNPQQGTRRAIVEIWRYHIRENQWDYFPARGSSLMDDRWDDKAVIRFTAETNVRSLGTRYSIPLVNRPFNENVLW